MQNSSKIATLEYAKDQDKKDPLQRFRAEFNLPTDANGKPKIYLCGNSLGLQPKLAQTYVQQELDDWAKLGVDGHTDAQNPWKPYHEFLSESMAKIVGAKASEVVMMNTLTVNLHLMMVSFYQPTSTRYKIIIESDAFPSDKYAVKSQLEFHGFNAEEALLEWTPREGEELCRYEDLEKLLKDNKGEVALLMLGNTNYYTGQKYPIKEITELGHAHNAIVGFDLAHGAGNIQPNLHENQVDFAVWCSYKYLNSGPGSVGGCFVHEKHANNKNLKRFAGWWGHNKDTRFNMRKEFDPIPGAEGWQLSNPPILSMAAIRASLEIFEKAGFENIRKKSEKLTGYLESLIENLGNNKIEIITPKNPADRGCQLSLKVKGADKKLFNQLSEAGVIADWREPNVIRVAPAPLYNSFEDVYEMVERLKKLLA
ncbi:kynureninase [Haloflavibacter putidus]|uniref:Kynureninase n=1 Tax=Haloflavibacter putidus TaxID=2576776 RepID=A0A507ZQH3_9FLAO|nr:kynureninase [Haloflavibacter putidus]TQD38851.1 kynureninase [Haloflavibacter putidus]